MCNMQKPAVKLDLPKAGDVFEFSYTWDAANSDKARTDTVRVIVVDVTSLHVLYKMPVISINGIFPMTLDTWRENNDGLRKTGHVEPLDIEDEKA